MEREKRQALISKLGLWNLEEGFRMLENDVLFLVDEYTRFSVEMFGAFNAGGAAAEDKNSGPGGLMVRTMRPEQYAQPFGPAFPAGSLKKRVAQAEQTVRVALLKHNVTEGKSGASFQAEGAGVDSGMVQRRQSVHRRGSTNETFLTREEIMVSIALAAAN